MQKESFPLRFLYGTAPGRAILRQLVKPGFSRWMGIVLDSRASKCIVPAYICRNRIPMDSYEPVSYRSFNDFFTRRRRADCLNIDETPSHLISPCDGYLTAYPIDGQHRFTIKHSSYDVAELLNDRLLAEGFEGGVCLVFRLTPKHYHRYCYIDGGRKGENYVLPGVLHCVRPIALAHYPVYIQNAREYTVLDTDHFGRVIQVEVGALMVGRICNEQGRGAIIRGDEKGHFAFGGSTIVLLLQKGAAAIDADILRRSARDEESSVRLGQRIGERTIT